MSCTGCHSPQTFPALNEFGRTFKATGFIKSGDEDDMLGDGERLSIPRVLNLSLYGKMRYENTHTDAIHDAGELQMPDEASLFSGGRVGKYVGYLMEVGINGGTTDTQAQSAGGAHSHGVNLMVGFKMPVLLSQNLFNSNGALGVVPYTTDSAGAAYGYEVLNTGAVNNIRVGEFAPEISASQYIQDPDSRDNSATGAATYYHHRLFHVAYSAYTPKHASPIVAKSILHYGRAAITPTIAGWDLALGGQVWAGSATVDDPTNSAINGSTAYTMVQNQAYVVDAQAMGNVGWLPVGFLTSYAYAPASSTGVSNSFNTDVNHAKSAFTATLDLAVVPGYLNFVSAYRIGKLPGTDANGNAILQQDNALTLALKYSFLMNFKLGFDVAFYSGDSALHPPGDHKTSIMLVGAF